MGAGTSSFLVHLKPLPAQAKLPILFCCFFLQVTNIPLGAILYDIAFDSADPNHGWIVGSKGTFLETTDGGKQWVPRCVSCRWALKHRAGKGLP